MDEDYGVSLPSQSVFFKMPSSDPKEALDTMPRPAVETIKKSPTSNNRNSLVHASVNKSSEKKTYLRKGSRREPSALHRILKEQGDITTIDSNDMSHTQSKRSESDASYQDMTHYQNGYCANLIKSSSKANVKTPATKKKSPRLSTASATRNNMSSTSANTSIASSNTGPSNVHMGPIGSNNQLPIQLFIPIKKKTLDSRHQPQPHSHPSIFHAHDNNLHRFDSDLDHLINREHDTIGSLALSLDLPALATDLHSRHVTQTRTLDDFALIEQQLLNSVSNGLGNNAQHTQLPNPNSAEELHKKYEQNNNNNVDIRANNVQTNDQRDMFQNPHETASEKLNLESFDPENSNDFSQTLRWNSPLLTSGNGYSNNNNRAYSPSTISTSVIKEVTEEEVEQWLQKSSSVSDKQFSTSAHSTNERIMTHQNGGTIKVATSRESSHRAPHQNSTIVNHNNTQSPSWGVATRPDLVVLELQSQSQPQTSHAYDSLSPPTQQSSYSAQFGHRVNSKYQQTEPTDNRKQDLNKGRLELESTELHEDQSTPTHTLNTQQHQQSFTRPSNIVTRGQVFTRPLMADILHQTPTLNRRAANRGKKGDTRIPLEEELTAREAQLISQSQELEHELEAFRKETAQAKALRKQYEATLADALREKADVTRWITEERNRLEAWVAEQKQIALRERRSAAKYVQEARQRVQQGDSGSVRREKAEIEMLATTLEKLRGEYNEVTKKAKMTEKRLQQLVFEAQHKSHCAEEEVKEKNNDILLLWRFIEDEGLNLPASIAKLRPAALSKEEGRDVGKDRHGGRKQGGYVERVNVGYEPVRPVVVTVAGPGMGVHASALGNNGVSNGILNRVSDMVPNGSRCKDAVSGFDGYEQYEQGVKTAALQQHAQEGMKDGADVFRASLESQGQHNQQGAGRYSKLNDSYDSDDEDYADDGREYHAGHNGQELWVRHEGQYRSQHQQNYMQPNATTSLELQNIKSTIDGDNMKLNTSGGDLSQGRSEQVLSDGRRVITYRNGTLKEVYTDGSTFVRFANGDTKLSRPSTGEVVYYYNEADTKHTTYTDGLEVYEFPNGQIEQHYPDGRKEIMFPDSTHRVMHPDGRIEELAVH